MDNDYVDNILAIAGPFDHALELGPAIARCRGSGLDELGHNRHASRLAPRPSLRTLIGYRQIMLCLAPRRYSQVNSRANDTIRAISEGC
jgi:hypothetical protein